MPVAAGGRTVTPKPSRPRWRRWPAHWPLTALFLGYPLWWVTGTASFMPILLAIPMAVQLVRVRRLVLPRGIGFWCLFLIWVIAGAFTLYVQAPGAVPGGGLGRLLVYGYRLSWYLACTVALLWVVNTTVRAMPTRTVMRVVGSMFVVIVGGGILGVLWPTLNFPSLLEVLLPARLTNVTFVHDLVHPGVAEVQTVLGAPSARPTAPFTFANAWGASLSMYLPFFVAACFGSRRRRHRLFGLVVLAASVVPVVYSLNRGLWAAIAIGVALLLVRQVLRARMAIVIGTMVILPLGLTVFAMSPLADTVISRMNHQHSNDRRYQLAVATVASTVEGSPIVGFGSTRDVSGNFTSIAGGATPDCDACAVPPLGTQGQLWLLVFATGIGGTLFYLGFLASAFVRSWRCRDPAETVCMSLLLFSVVEMFIYGAVGTPLFAVMIAIGLVCREQNRAASAEHGTSMADRRSADRMRHVGRHYRVVGGIVVLGIVAGWVFSEQAPQQYSADVTLLLTAPATHLVDDPALAVEDPEEVTIDTEAALVVSDSTVAEVDNKTIGLDTTDLPARVRITAAPNTRVLTLHVRAATARAAEETAHALAAAYLHSRRDYLQNRRRQAMHEYRTRENLLTTTPPSNPLNEATGQNLEGESAEEALLRTQDTLNRLTTSSDDAGEIIRTPEASAVQKARAVEMASGGAIGLLLGLALSLALPWHGWGQRRRRTARSGVD